jgi:glycine dehydrogenase
MPQPNFLEPNDTFVPRHIGPTDSDIQEMLATLSLPSLEALVEVTVPSDIRLQTSLTVPSPRGEQQVLAELRGLAGQNQVWRSLIGMGYYDCITPLVIQRNILEDPGWYTQYTPYQAEIAQGRLEALVNFQTMVADLTGLPLANASLLDEATAAAEAMTMCAAMSRAAGHERKKFFVSENCHPQTIAVVQTRAEPLGIVLQIGAIQSLDLSRDEFFGLLLQYPSTDGYVGDYSEFITRAHASGAYVVVATDLLALTLLRSPGEFGADVAVGSSQRFGVPLGFGGPHAAFLATKEEFRRQMPGRIIGVSKDVTGRVAYRLSLQTREQHIRREKATSNICTAQVLLAVMAGMYAVYHGPAGLRRIAERIHGLTMVLAEGLRRHGCAVGLEPVFDTLRVPLSPAQSDTILNRARQQKINLRQYDDQSLGLSLDEWSTVEEVQQVLALFVGHEIPAEEFQAILASVDVRYPAPLARTSPYLTHPVFHRYHAEHELLRYIHRLQSRDLSLVHSMIPLGSCTMKLNATAEMLPVTWPEFGRLHPFAPSEQAQGYQTIVSTARSLVG